MASNATSRCAQGSGIEILPNTTHTRVCGVQTLNTSLLSPCCGNQEVHTFNCQQYCSTNDDISKWASCIRQQSNSTSYSDMFCQAGVTGNNTESLKATSYALPRPSPSRISYMLMLLALLAVFTGDVSAKVVPSLASGSIGKRSTAQNSCTIQIAHNYTTVRPGSTILSTYQACGKAPCAIGAGSPFDTGIMQNNRTINGTSAADSTFDTFFEILQNQTGRWFPALSSTEIQYSFVTEQGDYRVNFTPYAWCANGTITGCSGVVGNSNETVPIEACGPVFVTEPNATTIHDAAIQGVVSLVQVS